VSSLLAQRGARVLLLERARFPRPKPCAEYLSPEAGVVLERLGALSAVERSRPARLGGMRIVSADGTAFTGRFGSHDGLALPRERFDDILLRHAARAGVDVREETAFDRFTAERGRLCVWSRPRGRRVPSAECRTPLVVAADGLNSRVTAALGLGRRGRRRWLALVTHATGVTGMTDVGEMHVTRDAYIGLAPLGDGLTNIAAVVRLDGAMPRPPAVWLERTIARLPEVRDRVAGARFVTRVRAVGPFARTTTRATADHVLLVGDAADFYDPFTGEGIYAALRGAELAADRVTAALATGRFRRAALAGYDDDRLRAFGGKWIVERLIGLATARPALLDHVAHRLARRPDLADVLVRVTGDLAPPSRMLRPSFLWRLVA
jgi:flavin-dependent dehydrogenase